MGSVIITVRPHGLRILYLALIVCDLLSYVTVLHIDGTAHVACIAYILSL